MKLGNSLMSSDWGRSTVFDTLPVPGMSASKRCQAVAGMDRICKGTDGNNGWLGVSQTWLSGSHITQGTVRVNDTYFNLPQYNYTTEKQHGMCQEAGYTFGLHYRDTSGASLNT